MGTACSCLCLLPFPAFPSCVDPHGLGLLHLCLKHLQCIRSAAILRLLDRMRINLSFQQDWHHPPSPDTALSALQLSGLLSHFQSELAPAQRLCYMHIPTEGLSASH